MKYNDNNLIKYEDTIRLHFDTTGRTAWLTLKNYGYVFGQPPTVPIPRIRDTFDPAVIVTVGVPALESGKLPSSPDDLFVIQKLGFKEGEFKPLPQTISIGEMLDAIDVIKLQVGILTATSKVKTSKVFTRRTLNVTLGAALHRLFPNRTFNMLYKEDDPDFFEDTLKCLSNNWLGFDPGAPAISKAIQAYSPRNVGFTAYFPDARLIAQEERTLMAQGEEGAKGKTKNNDTRAIVPIPSGMPNPTKVLVGEGMVQPQWEFQWMVDYLDIPVKRKNLEEFGREVKNAGAGNLHIQIDRISCFGFRGDDRNPQQMKAAGGFLPGVTRENPGYMAKFKLNAGPIDVTLPYRPTGRTEEEGKPFRKVLYEQLKQGPELTSKEISPELDKYLQAMKAGGIMSLLEYTSNQDFKGYVSATKSIAIAKGFANLWREEVDLTTYCYAVRCRGGFHLQSEVADPNVVEARAYLKTLHEFNSFAEQEVAVAGAIWWEHIVGTRILRCNKDGQFFFGPVFLQDDLMWEDNDAFSALFELLSGKSQGDAPGIIEKSYNQSPFECLGSGLAAKGANSMSSASTSPAPVVRLAPAKLTFGRQPVGARSAAQIVKLTNLGGEPLIVQSILKSGTKPGDFEVLSLESGAKGQTFSVTFAPQGDVKPNKRSEGRSEKKPFDVDERTATLEIKHNLSGSPEKVSLKGTAAPAVPLWNLSAEVLDFKEQGVNTTSAPKIVTLTNCSLEAPAITVEADGDFAVEGDYEDEKVRASYTLRVTFLPTREGKRPGALTIKHVANKAPLTVKLAGVGAKPKKKLELSAKILNFGKQPVDLSSVPLDGTLTNSGNVPITVESILPTGPDAAAFKWTTHAEPTVEAGQKRHINVTFYPTERRTYEAGLQITSDANDSPHTVTLKGSGVSTGLLPESLSFRDQKVGTASAALNVTLDNDSDTELSVTGIKIDGEPPMEFKWETPDAHRPTVKARGKRVISITFQPKAVGLRKTYLWVTYRAGGTLARTDFVSLTGTGIE